MSRKPLIAGNWKMNLNHLEAIALVQKIALSLPEKYYKNVDVVVIPPFTDLRSVQNVIEAEKFGLSFGAQDLSIHDSGAYTGEISGSFLTKLGCSYTIVGHSERRCYHHEDNTLIAHKAAAALRHNMTPIICIGEHLEIREANQHITYCLDQLCGSLLGLTCEQISKTVIAYEPVWAIGTGKVASANDAQEVCAAIRQKLTQLTSPAEANTIRILYGGSVNLKNITELITQPDIDGALVGGASLHGEQFAQIAAIAAGGPILE